MSGQRRHILRVPGSAILKAVTAVKPCSAMALIIKNA